MLSAFCSLYYWTKYAAPCDKEAEEEQDDKVEEAWECSDEAEIDEVINEADAYVGVTAAQLGVVRSALTKVS